MSGRAATTSVIEGKSAISVGDPGTPVPPGWLRVPLLSVAELGTGHTPSRSRSDYWEGGIPWIAIPDARDHHTGVITATTETVSQLGIENSAARILPAKTVGLSRTASVGYVFIMGRPMATSQDFVTWTCSDALDPRFLMYALLAEGDDIRKFGKGSTHTTIYFPEVKAFHLNLAPKPEQHRIVTKLDNLRARSSRARLELDHIPKLIERYKQAILAKAFSGELTKDWREQHPSDASHFIRTTGIAAATNKDADPLPEGWCWAHAGEICAIKSGIALGKKRSTDTQLVELPYLRVANVQRGWLKLSEIKTTFVTPREAEALYLRAGDVLMNEGGDRDKLGRGWVWEGQIENCIHQNHVFRLRPKSSQIPSRYISYYANEFGQRYFLDEGKQTTNLASISMSKVSALPIPMCTPNEMTVIVQRIEAAFAWLDKIATEHARAKHLLPKLDQAILAKAFRGELVPQDPNDEPAAALLERIKAERNGGTQTRPRAAKA